VKNKSYRKCLYGLAILLAFSITFNPHSKDSILQNTFQIEQKVLDLPIIFCRLIGGSADDKISSILTDSNGNIILCGLTTSSDFPIFEPSYDSTHNGEYDVFVFKFDSSGLPLWSTYIGGTQNDHNVRNIAIDSNNDIIITGETQSPDFPTINAYNSQLNGSSDIFLLKIDSKGDLLWSSFLGGTDADAGRSVIVDRQGDIIITGHTFSTNFPSKNSNPNRYQMPDGIVAKFSKEGELIWSANIGGGYNAEKLENVVLDEDGFIYLSGRIANIGFAPAVVSDQIHGYETGFLTKINPNGTKLWGKRVYSSSSSICHYISNNEKLVVLGRTTDRNYPLLNPIDNSLDGVSDGFIIEFSLEGEMLYSSFYAGNQLDMINCGVIDPFNNLIIGGRTNSTDIVIGTNSSSYGGNFDGFISLVSSNKSTYWYSYLGGQEYDTCTSVTLDINFDLLVAGTTNSIDFPSNKEAFGSLGNNDIYITKITHPEPSITQFIQKSRPNLSINMFTFFFLSILCLGLGVLLGRALEHY